MTKPADAKELINVPEGTKELVIRYGEAEKILAPSIRLALTGRLDSAKRFLAAKSKTYQPIKAHVIIDTGKASVSLHLNEKDHFGDVIEGSLTTSPFLAEWGINTTKRWDVYTLLTFVKRNKFFFPDSAQWLEMINYLNNFKGKVTTDFVRTQDSRGNSNNSTIRAVSSDAPKEFKLSLPLFAGYAAVTFLVEVCIDAQSTEIRLFMESAELFGLIEKEKLALLAAEEKFFTEYGAAVIYK